ncbi:MAG: MFS transporter [Proteobacteria bacterium]|nr:MFS transporter [Pseudomonadota bacterium]
MNVWFLHFFLGLSSGLPLLLTWSTLQAWMTESHVNLKVIGIFALVRTPYNFKFLWAPLMDRIRLPFLTRRRAWMIVTQMLIAASLFGLGKTDPVASPFMVALFAVLVSFFSASQDIVIDAYRTETLEGAVQGLATSSYITGYRVGMLIAGALALYVGGHYQLGWATIYSMMAGLMLIGVFAAYVAPEGTNVPAPRTLAEAVVEPFSEFLTRRGALWMIALIIFFKFGDNLAGSMTTPYILSNGYTKEEYAIVAKGYGLAAALLGGIIGGPVMVRLGVIRSLWVFGLGQALAVSGFIWLSMVPKSIPILAAVIMGENFFIGCGSAAFSTYISNITNPRYTATQFALLTSLTTLSSTVLTVPSGFLVEKLGWTAFFVLCVALAVPGLLLITRVKSLPSPVHSAPVKN